MRALLVALALAACASAPTPGGISADLGDRLQDLRGWPLAVRCQAVEDAAARCARAGLPPDCAWDGWHDRDQDDFTIRACLARRGH